MSRLKVLIAGLLIWLSVKPACPQVPALNKYPKNVLVTEALADVDEFFQTLQDVHPDLLAKVRVEDYLELKSRTFKEVTKKAGGNQMIRVRDLAYILSYAAAFFKDGHTNIQWWELAQGENGCNERNAAGMRFPPFLLEFHNGKFLIGRALDQEIAGMEVSAINGILIDRFLEPILDRHSGETFAYQASATFNSRWAQQFWWFFTDLVSFKKKLKVTMQSRTASKSERLLSTVDYNAFHMLAMANDRLGNNKPPGARVNFLVGGRIAVFTFPSFLESAEKKETIDRIFYEIKEKRSQSLILDLRGNEGGSSSMGEFILSYLTDKKFHTFSKSQVKISEELLDHPEQHKIDYHWTTLPSLKGMTVTMISEEQQHQKPAAAYQGKFYLLVDNQTFSAASNFAAMVRDYEVGEIIGYETGGLPIEFGDSLSLTLKHSGIPYGVSCKKFWGPRPRTGDDEHGVLPDVALTEDVLERYKNEQDPALAFTADRAKSQFKNWRARRACDF